MSSFNTDVHDTDRAPVQSSHDTQRLLISKSEASRRDQETKKRLLKSRKLSLVVDLDQTIIHAAVEPTIAEWQQDKDNPNHEAVKDVRAFQLFDEGSGMRACWYYIKLRPGLEDFLDQISKIYELHIYTMGTRAYAEKIAELVDPEGKYFKNRILSRDESGSMTIKNLERLFPVDTKMVVIIDDRGDVWKWNANLIRVVPFDFFVGIGDINSSFLPKKQEIRIAPKASVPVEVKLDAPSTNGKAGEDSPAPEITVLDDGPPATTNGTDTSALEQLVAMGGSNDPVALESQTKDQNETIITQLEEKPLAQLQKKIDEEDQAAAEAMTASQEDSSAPVEAQKAESIASSESSQDTEEATQKPPVRHSLLRNDDRELDSLSSRLTAVHTAFFSEYDRRRAGQKGGRVAALSNKGRKIEPPADSSSSEDLLLVPDVKTIMPEMKQRALSTVTLVFSGILPIDTNVHTADISLWAKTFGATIANSVTRDVTHVVANRSGTHKVKQALKRGLPVVSLQWLIDCMTRWSFLPEKQYLLEDVRPSRGARQASATPSVKDKDDAAARQEIIYGAPRYPLSEDEDDAEDETTGIDTEAEPDSSRSNRTNGSGPERKRLKLDTSPEDAEDAEMNGLAALADTSPLSIHQDQWDDMNRELEEFMGSEAGGSSSSDDEDAGEGGEGGGVGDSTGAQAVTSTGPGKRKRDPSLDGDGEVPLAAGEGREKGEDGGDSDSTDELARELEREFEDDDDGDED